MDGAGPMMVFVASPKISLILYPQNEVKRCMQDGVFQPEIPFFFYKIEGILEQGMA